MPLCWTRLGFALSLLTTALATMGCSDAGEGADEAGEEADARAQDLSEAGHLQIVQFNPFYGGQYPKGAYAKEHYTKLPHTYETAEAFAALLHSKYPNAAVIGMQEIVSAGNVEEIRQRLAQATGKPWSVQHFGKAKFAEEGFTSTQEAIFWREDVVGLLDGFGSREVQRYRAKKGVIVSVRFGGALLYKKDNGRPFGFFTGKLTPRNQVAPNGQPLDDQDKVAEIATLRKWITDKMSDHPDATRIVAMDMNAFYGSAPWKRMAAEFAEGHDDTATWQSPHTGTWHRYDYIWWDFDAGSERPGGFFDDSHVMGTTGSDHKAVIADVYVRDPLGEVPGHACDVRCGDEQLYKVYGGSQGECRDLWTVCREHGYAKRIRWNGDLIFEK